MDLELIEARLAELRARREFIPELRDYKPQARKTKATKEPATAVGTRDTEDVFGALFATNEKEEANDPHTEIRSANDQGPGSDSPQDPHQATSILGGILDGDSNVNLESLK